MSGNSQSTRIGWLCGWGTTAQVWSPFLASWNDPNVEHVILPVWEWFAQSNSPDDVLLAAVTAIRNLADQARSTSQKWRLIGWSLGGMTALGALLQIQSSDQENREWMNNFVGIDLLGSTLCFTADPPRAGWSPRVLEMMKKGIANNEEEGSRVLRRFREQVGLTEEMIPSASESMGAWGRNGLLVGLDALLTWDFREAWLGCGKSNDQISLKWSLGWLHGTADKTCPIAAMPRELPVAGAQLSGWKIELQQLEGTGHALFLEEPDKVGAWLCRAKGGESDVE